VLITGGMVENGRFLATSEVYDLATKRFSPAGIMASPRVSHTAILLDSGMVMVAGGLGGRRQEAGRWVGNTLRTTDLYDPATRQFTAGALMNTPREDHAAVKLSDGRVLIAGGSADGRAMAGAEVYDPVLSAFTPIASMHTPRSSPVAIRLLDGCVLVAGGSGPDHSVLKSAELYDPRVGEWQVVGPMTLPRYKHGAALMKDGRVLIAGGSDDRDWQGQYDSTEIYDPARKTFTAERGMRRKRFKLGRAVISLNDGRVLIAGGASTAEIYDPLARVFTSVEGDLGDSLYFSTATLLPGGKVLIAGGYKDGGALCSRSAWICLPG